MGRMVLVRMTFTKGDRSELSMGHARVHRRGFTALRGCFIHQAFPGPGVTLTGSIPLGALRRTLCRKLLPGGCLVFLQRTITGSM